jgi:hypothetical protein
MKQIYLSPQTDIIKIETCQVLSASTGFAETPATGPSLSRQFEDFIDEDELD